MKTLKTTIWNFLETCCRARAASELCRLGYHEQAKHLMNKEFG
jgi:hypothetical protein